MLMNLSYFFEAFRQDTYDLEEELITKFDKDEVKSFQEWLDIFIVHYSPPKQENASNKLKKAYLVSEVVDVQ